MEHIYFISVEEADNLRDNYAVVAEDLISAVMKATENINGSFFIRDGGEAKGEDLVEIQDSTLFCNNYCFFVSQTYSGKGGKYSVTIEFMRDLNRDNNVIDISEWLYEEP